MPCVRAYSSDIIRGLERVLALRSAYSVASVNMSLGSGAYTEACDWYPAKPVIDSLLLAGIPTIIASGNGGFKEGISAPACIATAVSVGSTNTNDTVSSFSNSGAMLHLLATGSSINSAVPGGGFSVMGGTSMAAPHVAGAWAVLKSAQPLATASEVFTALQVTGRSVADPVNGIVRPRIDVAAAVEELTSESPQPPAPMPAPVANPASMVTGTSFTATWTAVSGAVG